MARRRYSRGCNARSASCWSCLLLIFLTFSVFLPDYFQQTIAIQKELLSRITSETPISGFYGPGAWLAWLVGLGMTHGHAVWAMMAHGELKHEWDYDLIGASGYMIAAAVDLVSKAKAVSQLGEAAHTSSLLPALLCAERVVVVGTGSSLFSLTIALTSLNSGGIRSLCIAASAVLFAVVASFYAFNAHQAIFKTTPVIWCRLHDGHKPMKNEFSFTAVDMPGFLGEGTITLSQLYTVREYWIITGIISAIISLISFVANLWNGRKLMVALSATVAGAVTPVALFVGFPMVCTGLVIAMGTILWVLLWVCFFWVVYIQAFLPWLGYFPLTGMSLLDMDQISAFVGVLVIAALRTLHPILKMQRHEESAEGTRELMPLLAGPAPAPGPEAGMASGASSGSVRNFPRDVEGADASSGD
ncbi:hypothetical protein K438DRAFT_1785122 [Mycena galopus ATCC 62051]|nr:hypothetical protein K438DRAFT_1785122 [Mycena galopus ATCC 62051]